MRNLRIALSKKEKASGLLDRLEELKEAGEVDDDAYAVKKEQYERLAQEGESELEAIHATLSTKLESLKRDLEKYPQELKDLELSSKLGEIDSEVFTKQDEKLRAKIKKLEDDAAETEKHLEAETAEEAGGFIEVSIDGSQSVKDKLTGWIRRK